MVDGHININNGTQETDEFTFSVQSVRDEIKTPNQCEVIIISFQEISKDQYDLFRTEMGYL